MLKKLINYFKPPTYTLGSQVFYCRSWVEKQMQEHSINEQFMKSIARKAEEQKAIKEEESWYTKYI